MDNSFDLKGKWMKVAEDALAKMYEGFENMFKDDSEYNKEGYMATQFSLQQRTDSIGRIIESTANEHGLEVEDIGLMINDVTGDDLSSPDFIDISVVNKDGMSYANIGIDPRSEIVEVTKHDAIAPEVDHAINTAVRDLNITDEEEKFNLANMGKEYDTDRIPEAKILTENGYTEKEIKDLTPTKYKHDLAKDEARTIKSEINMLKAERVNLTAKAMDLSGDEFKSCKSEIDRITEKIEQKTKDYLNEKQKIKENNLPHRMIHAGLNTLKSINNNIKFASLTFQTEAKETVAKFNKSINSMDKSLCSFEYGVAKSQAKRLQNKIMNLEQKYQKRRNRFANLKGVFTGKNEIENVSKENTRLQQARINSLKQEVIECENAAKVAEKQYNMLKENDLALLHEARDMKYKIGGNTKTLDEKISEVKSRTVENNKKPATKSRDDGPVRER